MAGFPSFSSIAYNIYTTSLSVQPLMDTWVAFVSWLLRITLLWTRECRYLLKVLFYVHGHTTLNAPILIRSHKILFSFPLHMDPEVEMLDHMVFLFLTFWGTSILFPQWLHQCAFPAVMQEGSLFSTRCQHLLSLVLLLVAILTGMRRHLMVLLTPVSLVIREIAHLFGYQLAIHLSSLGKCLLGYFAHFFIRSFVSSPSVFIAE